jgi:ribosomal protein S18 acetylase RimI-like enzyme
MSEIEIVEVTDEHSFGLLPPCADSRFDHRTCDYWENADRGSKLYRPQLLRPERRPEPAAQSAVDDNPFAPPARAAEDNPFMPAGGRTELPDSFADDDLFATPLENPFVPTTRRERPLRQGVPRKLGLLDRGRGVFGSYAKVMLADGEPVAYCQFGPLSAYPRAQRLRELYSQLPDAPLPAIISCVSTTTEARRRGFARRLVEDVCADLAERGFSAIEAYPDLTRDEDETSAGRPIFWHALGFATAVDDERFPVMRREL